MYIDANHKIEENEVEEGNIRLKESKYKDYFFDLSTYLYPALGIERKYIALSINHYAQNSATDRYINLFNRLQIK